MADAPAGRRPRRTRALGSRRAARAHPAVHRPHARGRAIEHHRPHRRRDRPVGGAAPPAAARRARHRARHGPRAPHHQRAGAHAGAGAGHHGDVPRRRRDRRAVLRDVVRRGRRARDRRRRRGLDDRRRAPRRGRVARRHARRAARSRHRRGGPRRLRQARGPRRPASSSGGSRSSRRATPRSSRRSPRRSSGCTACSRRASPSSRAPRSCTATSASATPSSTRSAGDVRAVLDWEICTLGDPLADVGYLLATWGQADDPVRTQQHAPSTAAGFPTRDELCAALRRGLGPRPGARRVLHDLLVVAAVLHPHRRAHPHAVGRAGRGRSRRARGVPGPGEQLRRAGRRARRGPVSRTVNVGVRRPRGTP